MNYPSIWLPIAKFFSLDDEAHYIAFVGIYCALYFLATALLLWRFPSIWLFLAATSNAALMVVERGNNDVIIFLLSLVASVLINPGPILLIVITATYLKIYPLVLIIGLRDRPVWFALGIAALSTILMLHYDDLSKIVAGTPVSSMISFGTKSIERMFAFNFMLNWLGRQVMWWEILLAHAAVVGLLAWRFKRHIQALPMHTEDFDGRLFVSGAAIYLFTFAFGGNFDYRLVFLVLCIPWLNRIGSTRVIQITLFSMLLAMYADLLQKLGPLGWLVAVIAKSEIFIVLGLLLLNVVFRAKAFRTFLSSVASVRPSR